MSTVLIFGPLPSILPALTVAVIIVVVVVVIIPLSTILMLNSLLPCVLYCKRVQVVVIVTLRRNSLGAKSPNQKRRGLNGGT